MDGADGGRELPLGGVLCDPAVACMEWLPCAICCACSAPISAARKAVASGDSACSEGLDCLKCSSSCWWRWASSADVLLLNSGCGGGPGGVRCPSIVGVWLSDSLRCLPP